MTKGVEGYFSDIKPLLPRHLVQGFNIFKDFSKNKTFPVDLPMHKGVEDKVSFGRRITKGKRLTISDSLEKLQNCLLTVLGCEHDIPFRLVPVLDNVADAAQFDHGMPYIVQIWAIAAPSMFSQIAPNLFSSSLALFFEPVQVETVTKGPFLTVTGDEL